MTRVTRVIRRASQYLPSYVPPCSGVSPRSSAEILGLHQPERLVHHEHDQEGVQQALLSGQVRLRRVLQDRHHWSAHGTGHHTGALALMGSEGTEASPMRKSSGNAQAPCHPVRNLHNAPAIWRPGRSPSTRPGKVPRIVRPAVRAYQLKERRRPSHHNAVRAGQVLQLIAGQVEPVAVHDLPGLCIRGRQIQHPLPAGRHPCE
jgi:hypothetical protein